MVSGRITKLYAALTGGQAVALAALIVGTIAYTFNIGGFRTTAHNAIAWALKGLVTSAGKIAKAFSRLGTWVAVIIARIVVANLAYLSSSKTLADTKLKIPPSKERAYQFAVVNKRGALARIPGKMTYSEAVASLASSAVINSWEKKYKNFGGIYTNNQAHAKALAVRFGATKKPETHGDGFYDHYHDKARKFHVWYGGPIRYK